MKNNWTEEDKFEICAKLEIMQGADITDEERETLRDAISIICPGYGEALQEEEDELAAYAEQVLADLKAHPEKVEPAPRSFWDKVEERKKKRGDPS